METSLQDMKSLSDYHWLFSDGLPPEDEYLPPFVPRVLNFDEANKQPHDYSNLDTTPGLGQTESRGEASNPIFSSPSHTDQSYVAHGECSNCLSSGPLSKRSCPSPSQSSGVQSCALKRRNDNYEDFPSKRRHPRSPVYGATYTSEVEHFAPSPIFMASQSTQSYKPNIESSHSSWHHSNESHSSRQVTSLEKKNTHELSDLNESKRCIKYLLEEIRKMIDSNRYGENSEITYQTIKRAEYRLRSFIETSHIMSQIVSAQDTIESYSPTTEDSNTYNPFFFSYDASQVAPASQCDPKGFSNPINPTSYCYATPLDNTCDCLLLAPGEASSHSEIGDILSSNPIFSQSKSISLNPTITNDVMPPNSVDESPGCWLETPSALHQSEPPLFFNTFNEHYQNLVQDHPSIKDIYI